jgi:hypothetical protein
MYYRVVAERTHGWAPFAMVRGVFSELLKSIRLGSEWGDCVLTCATRGDRRLVINARRYTGLQVSGDVTANNRKNKLIFLYELEVNISWKGTLAFLLLRPCFVLSHPFY